MAFQFGVPFAEFDFTPGKPEFCRAGELLLASAAVIRGGGGGVVGLFSLKVETAVAYAACGFALAPPALAAGVDATFREAEFPVLCNRDCSEADPVPDFGVLLTAVSRAADRDG